MKYTHVFWDWNGTLVDDAQWCVDCENLLLERRGMKPIESVARFREMFAFPVRRFYEELGYVLDDAAYAAIGDEWHAAYDGDPGKLVLFDDARPTLEALRAAGVTQTIVSACEQNLLEKHVTQLGIRGFFADLCGVPDLLGAGKVASARAFIRKHPLPPGGRALFVGDTLHDRDTAQAIGADCVLVPRGHISRDRLAQGGAPVLDDLAAVAAYALSA